MLAQMRGAATHRAAAPGGVACRLRRRKQKAQKEQKGQKVLFALLPFLPFLLPSRITHKIVACP
jgi:hypothetical protein